MIDGLYDIAVDTPKLHRRGTLSLKSNEGKIAGILNVGDLQDARFAGTCEGKEFEFEGSGEFPTVGQIDYVAKGSIWGNSLDIKCETSAGVITMFGTQIGSSAGAVRSSHDFIMSASSGDFSDKDGTMFSGLYADGG
ncbi:MAG: hypothetical protein IKF56_02180 [Eggerthellaceae bacterium]|nr:hypothetical protein [Eggerthellaceae bacterium]